MEQSDRRRSPDNFSALAYLTRWGDRSPCAISPRRPLHLPHISSDDVVNIAELANGSGGTVYKAKHTPTSI